MSNHKRGKPKNSRAGCLMCKPHKANGAKDKEKASVKRKLIESEDIGPEMLASDCDHGFECGLDLMCPCSCHKYLE